MKTFHRTVLVLLLIALPTAISAADLKGDVVHLDSGPISGKIEDGVRLFAGIPYAAPPVGDLRWKPPQAVAAWTPVRETTEFGPSCPQPRQQETGQFRPGTALARKLGVHHGVELAYVFGNMNKSDGYTDTDLGLSKKMMDYWVNFAKTGNPNGPGLAAWPAYKSKSDLNLEFSDTPRLNHHLFKKEVDFISRHSTFRAE